MLSFADPGTRAVQKTLESVTFVGLVVRDKAPLVDAVARHCTGTGIKAVAGTVMCDHLTTVFFGQTRSRFGKKQKPPSAEQSASAVPHGCACTVHLDALVISWAEGEGGCTQAAFRATSVVRDDTGATVPVSSGVPHITAFLSGGAKAADSAKIVRLSTAGSTAAVTVIPIDLAVPTTASWC
jgi:hypothetical protein